MIVVEKIVTLAVLPWYITSVTGFAFFTALHTAVNTIKEIPVP